MLDVQRILSKYGLLRSCTTYPSYNERLVQHLLSGVENQASLCDALAILKMFHRDSCGQRPFAHDIPGRGRHVL